MSAHLQIAGSCFWGEIFTTNVSVFTSRWHPGDRCLGAELIFVKSLEFYPKNHNISDTNLRFFSISIHSIRMLSQFTFLYSHIMLPSVAMANKFQREWEMRPVWEKFIPNIPAKKNASCGCRCAPQFAHCTSVHCISHCNSCIFLRCISLRCIFRCSIFLYCVFLCCIFLRFIFLSFIFLLLIFQCMLSYMDVGVAMQFPGLKIWRNTKKND